ncbi:FecR family protein [Arsenicibacter rosenii]|uniref:Iron dicitrate transport regulator FecR n=1 Tax=Arsenicibacter rosenii TaxID=1750698 RepID=A0A1S2VHE7_9BACT|nr:FecR family protein [Arsenicibacter rosenii]OIN57298.1 hypothetical protein BLX24_20155 [Arsenicibacter rosenii]
MPDYIHYTFDDFVQDERFRNWALTDPPADREFWSSWLQANPDKLDLVLAARQFVINMHRAHDELTDDEFNTELSRIRIAREQSPVEEVAVRPNRSGMWLRVAATVTLIAGLGGWFYWYGTDARSPVAGFKQMAAQQAGGVKEVTNDEEAPKQVQLPDGSQVTLKKGSRISFPAMFGPQERSVFLVGEAFFDIVRRPKHPFLVYTNRLTTKVLGTSFTVRAYEGDKAARVIVRTGKVSVFTTGPGNQPGAIDTENPAVILTPNQQVTLEDKQLKRTLVSDPVPVLKPVAAAEEAAVKAMFFDRTPVVSIFKKLESTYGIMINYDADLLSGCELTAEFSNESFFDRLDLICRATDSRFEVIDAQIVIYSKGCRQAK